jgi:hypothetical protein
MFDSRAFFAEEVATGFTPFASFDKFFFPVPFSRRTKK